MHSDSWFTYFEGPGRGIVKIGGEQQAVAAGKLVESPAGIPHRLLNEGEGVFRCLVLKTPRPSAAARLLCGGREEGWVASGSRSREG